MLQPEVSFLTFYGHKGPHQRESSSYCHLLDARKKIFELSLLIRERKGEMPRKGHVTEEL